LRNRTTHDTIKVRAARANGVLLGRARAVLI